MKLLNFFYKNTFQHRYYSSFNLIDKILPKNDGNIALVSLSNNIFYNLAFENYLAETINSKSRNILLLWISSPSIVFGRHQNPWIECDVKEAYSKSVTLARRYSGGGCVYHDLGNLNISFLTDRLKYNRKFNLTIIQDMLKKCQFKDVSFEITPRHDIFVKNEKNLNESFKVTGSAARLAQKFSYHHCTLLYDANIENMKLLKSNLIDRIVSKATPSVRSKCINLKSFAEENLNLNEIIIRLCQEYWKMNSQNWGSEYLFHYVNPEEEEFRKLYEKNIQELQSWDFQFGATPKFQLHIGLASNKKLILTIISGEIKEFQIEPKNDLEDKNLLDGLNLFLNCKLKESILVDLFTKHDLINLDVNFKHIYEFIKKNIS